MLKSAGCRFPPLIKYFLNARLICRFDSCWESPYDLYLETIVGRCVTWPVCWSEGQRDWLIGDDDQLRDLVGESRDQLRGNALTGHVLSLYHSKHELTGRLMLVAEKSVPVCWTWISGTKNWSHSRRECKECTSDLWPASWFGQDTRLVNWRWRQYSRSLCDALPGTLQSTKPHYRHQGRVCKAGTVVTVDVSSEERTSDLPGRWKHVTSFVVGRKDTRLADWIWRQRSRSFVLAGRLMLWKQRSLDQCAL